MNRNLFLLIQGQFISTVGTQMALTATLFWTRQHIDSALMLGLLMAACAAPPVLLGPFGGAWADRHSRKNIILFCDIAGGILQLSLALFLWFLPEHAAPNIAAVFAVNICLAALQAFFSPAVSAAVPDLASEGKVAAGMSWSQSVGVVGSVAGQAAGGLLLPLGIPILFAFDGLSYLATAAAESFIVLPHTHKRIGQPARPRFWAETLSGFRYVSQRPGMRTLFLSAIPLNMLAAPVLVLLPIYTTDVLHLSSTWYGYFMAAFSAGSMVGYILAGVIHVAGRRLLAAVCASVFLTSALIASFGWSASALGAFAGLFFMGLLMGWVSITTLTILQLATEKNARGRVFGVVFTATQGMTPIAMLLAGLAADLTGHNLRLIYTVAGCGSLIIGVRLSLSPALRHFFVSAARTERGDG